jgi:hypothetical protein
VAFQVKDPRTGVPLSAECLAAAVAAAEQATPLYVTQTADTDLLERQRKLVNDAALAAIDAYNAAHPAP